MRILHMIGKLEMGGSQTMVMALYHAIDRNKIQFDFITDCGAQGIFEDEIRQLGGRIFQLPKFNGRNYSQVRSAWDAFFSDHPEYRVLHSHVRSYASIYLPVAKAHGVKTIIHSHNTSNGHGLAAAGKTILQYPLRFQADYYFACSELAGRWLFGKRVLKSDRYYMVRNAVDLKRFAYRPLVRGKIRQELGIGENTLLIGHVGRMNPQKNHAFLIDCFRGIVDRRKDAKLMLLGDGELREEITEQIRCLGLKDKVMMLGVKENPEDYFSAMDCLLLPSLHEGLPVVIVEAQANGLPCFVSDTVTKEVQLSELVRYLPISQGEDPWVRAVLECGQNREDVTEKIKASGFSVEESAKWLCDFYLRIADQG